MSKATIDGTTGLPKKDSNGDYWSAPVQCTAEDGENGEYTDFKYQTTVGSTPTRDATSDNPGSGWRDTPYYLDYDSSIQQYIWMITAVKVNGKLKDGTTWSTPVRINGEDGKDGEKGDKGDKGEDGIGSTTYQLIVSPQTVRVTASGEVYSSTKSVTTYVVKTYGDEVTRISDVATLQQEGLKVSFVGIRQGSYTKDVSTSANVKSLTANWSYSSTEYATVNDSGVVTIHSQSSCDIVLYKGSTEIARQTVSVVKDGAAGAKGDAGEQGAAGERGQIGKMLYPAGEFDVNTTYTSTAMLAPYVLYGTDYYYLAADSYLGSTAKHNNPATDAANQAGNWVVIEKHKAIFAEILMADFAKLSSAVFSGDYMFSQYGTYNEFENWWMATGTCTTDGGSITKVDWSNSTIEKVTGNENREFRFALGALTAPSIDTSKREPSGWSLIPPTIIDENDTRMWVTYADISSDGTVDEWITPFPVSGSNTYNNGDEVRCFISSTVEPTQPSGTSICPGDWKYYPSAVTTENSTMYGKFDGNTDRFDPNISIDFKTGAVRLNNAVIRGTLSTPKTYINSGNYQQYTYNPLSNLNINYVIHELSFDNLTDFVVIDSGVPELHITMPSIYSNGKYTSVQLENYRSYIGKTFKFYNQSGNSMSITGRTRKVGSSSSTSFELKAGYCVALTCVLDADDGIEATIWEYYSTAKIQTV
jgi:hypothetical protein